MSFNSDEFGINGDVSQRGQGPTAFTYRSLTDDKATVLGSGYFAGAKDYLDVGSQIACEATDGSFNGVVTGLSPVTVVDKGLSAQAVAMMEPTGFPLAENGEIDRESSILSWDDGTRTFTIGPDTGSGKNEYSVWINAVEFTFTEPQSCVIDDTEGQWYFYLDADGVLQCTNVFDIAIIYNLGFCSAGYWDATNKKMLFGGPTDERHGCKMDGHTHARLHTVDGAGYTGGLFLTGILSDQTGGDDTHAQFGVQSGGFRDEDLTFSIDALLSTVGVARVLYKDGSLNWRESSPTSGFSVLNTGTGRLAYNPVSGGLVEVGNTDLVLYHLAVTSGGGNDKKGQVFAIPGENTYTNITDLRNNSAREVNDIIVGLAGLPAAEVLIFASVGFQTSDAYANGAKARVRTLDDGGDYYFYPRSQLSVERTTS